MEKVARTLVIFLIAATLSLPFLGRWLMDARPAAGATMELHARMPENGGWSLESIQAQVNQPVTLRMTSDDVVHSFALGQSELPPVDITPGEWVETTLEFDQPGEYTYYCTRWCGANHWRMRGVIEVSGNSPFDDAKQEPPLFLEMNIDLDAPHPAENLPSERPDASSGSYLDDLLPNHTRDVREMQSISPSDLWKRLRNEANLAGESDQQIWDAVARIYSQLPGGESLQNAGELYRQNCLACHGTQGKGDGVMVRDLPPMDDHTSMGREATRPPDFNDPKILLGASPALLEGKIIRGGMGTGMPYWGSIFTREQIQALVLYLYYFQMDFEEVR